MSVLMFPGQGSQKKGMGVDLFDKVPQFLELENHVDTLLGYSFRDVCTNNRDDILASTEYTQPCLYLVNALHYFNYINEGGEFSTCLGHSLGEYNALLSAGAFDLLTGLRLVIKRGALMSKVKSGGMLAVLGLKKEQIEDVLTSYADVDIANNNSDTQTVLSGPKDRFDSLSVDLEKKGAKICLPLNVSAPFHSRYMEAVSNEFKVYLKQFAFNKINKTVISNITADKYPPDDTDYVIKNYLVRQIKEPVYWLDSIKSLKESGEREFVELGPGNVLTRLLDSIG